MNENKTSFSKLNRSQLYEKMKIHNFFQVYTMLVVVVIEIRSYFNYIGSEL